MHYNLQITAHWIYKTFFAIKTLIYLHFSALSHEAEAMKRRFSILITAHSSHIIYVISFILFSQIYPVWKLTKNSTFCLFWYLIIVISRILSFSAAAASLDSLQRLDWLIRTPLSSLTEPWAPLTPNVLTKCSILCRQIRNRDQHSQILQTNTTTAIATQGLHSY